LRAEDSLNKIQSDPMTSDNDIY